MPPFALPPLDPQIEITLSSRGMSQGLAQTEGMQIIPRASVRSGPVQIGTQWRNVSSPVASGVLALFVRYERRIAGFQLDAAAAYRFRTGAAAALDREAWEFTARARRSAGRLGLRASVEYSPREFENGPSLYAELGSSFDIGDDGAVSANIARRERDGGPGYTACNAGVSGVVWRRLSLDARYYWTSRAELGDRFGGRFVVSARLTM